MQVHKGTTKKGSTYCLNFMIINFSLIRDRHVCMIKLMRILKRSNQQIHMFLYEIKIYFIIIHYFRSNKKRWNIYGLFYTYSNKGINFVSFIRICTLTESKFNWSYSWYTSCTDICFTVLSFRTIVRLFLDWWISIQNMVLLKHL